MLNKHQRKKVDALGTLSTRLLALGHEHTQVISDTQELSTTSRIGRSGERLRILFRFSQLSLRLEYIPALALEIAQN